MNDTPTSHDPTGSLADDGLCPQCGIGRLIIRDCKVLCESCGYVESCEDVFVPNQDNPREKPRDDPAKAPTC